MSLRIVALRESPGTSVDLLSLVGRIAEGDRVALANLYRVQCSPVLEVLRSVLPEPAARAVAGETFVEVWWLARFHTMPGTDVSDWVADIARRRAAERAAAGNAPLWGDLRDRQADLTLATLLAEAGYGSKQDSSWWQHN